MRISNVYNQEINEWNANESKSDGTDFIQSVKPILIRGIYSVDILYKMEILKKEV